MIAGHTFAETENGRRCTTHNNQGLLCYRSWIDIKDTMENEIGQLNVAHNGTLNTSEYNEIKIERQREIDDVWKAVSDAASSGSR